MWADRAIFSSNYVNRKTSISAETTITTKLADAANKAHGAGAQNQRRRSQPIPRASFAPSFKGNTPSNSKQFTAQRFDRAAYNMGIATSAA